MKRYGKRVNTVEEMENLESSKKMMDPMKLTKGEAANIITRLKHGAQERLSLLLYAREIRQLMFVTASA